MRPIELVARALAEELPEDPAAHRTVLLNSPYEFLPLGAAIAYGNAHPKARPRAVGTLYAGSSALELTRSDERTLELAAAQGWGAHPKERMFTAPRSMPKLAEQRRIGPMQVTVLALTPSGRPARVRFQFDTPLTAANLHWLVWQDKHAVPWTVPAIGAHVSLPEQSLFSSLPRD
jgi:hypothetical protein